MGRIKAFFKSRRIGYYLMIAALLSAIVSLILYLTTGVSEFVPKLDGAVTAAFIIFIVVCAVTLVFELRILKLCAFAVGLYAFLRYLVFEVNYITNLFVSIDPTELTAGFVLTVVFSVVACIVALVAAILTKTGLEPLKIKEEQV